MKGKMLSDNALKKNHKGERKIQKREDCGGNIQVT